MGSAEVSQYAMDEQSMLHVNLARLNDEAKSLKTGLNDLNKEVEEIRLSQAAAGRMPVWAWAVIVALLINGSGLLIWGGRVSELVSALPELQRSVVAYTSTAASLNEKVAQLGRDVTGMQAEVTRNLRYAVSREDLISIRSELESRINARCEDTARRVETVEGNSIKLHDRIDRIYDRNPSLKR